MQPLKHFLCDIHIASQIWHLGQFCNDEHLGQGNMWITGQKTINNMVREYQSGSGGGEGEDDDDEQGEGMIWQKEWIQMERGGAW